jgi:fructose-bisphosphate aldolase class I
MSIPLEQLTSTINSILSDSRGILAADESFGTIKKRLSKIGVEPTSETRRSYRELLFTTKGIDQYISGVILFDETIHQQTSSGMPMAQYLSEKGIIPGIKVDKGTKYLSLYEGEKITEGLDSLDERLEEYKKLGARFAKWRAVIAIAHGLPTRFCIDANAFVLARYAALCQQAGIVPIVEPEVLMDGDHNIEKCEKITTTLLQSVFQHLSYHRVHPEGLLLKPNMVLPGKNSPVKATDEEVANATIRALRRSVPAAVPGIAFLSGGQSPLEATQRLAAINKTGEQPWKLTFSFSRALQEPPLDIWHGNKENTEKAQSVFLHRARCNAAARRGNYSELIELQE